MHWRIYRAQLNDGVRTEILGTRFIHGGPLANPRCSTPQEIYPLRSALPQPDWHPIPKLDGEPGSHLELCQRAELFCRSRRAILYCSDISSLRSEDVGRHRLNAFLIRRAQFLATIQNRGTHKRSGKSSSNWRLSSRNELIRGPVKSTGSGGAVPYPPTVLLSSGC